MYVHAVFLPPILLNLSTAACLVRYQSAPRITPAVRIQDIPLKLASLYPRSLVLYFISCDPIQLSPLMLKHTTETCTCELILIYQYILTRRIQWCYTRYGRGQLAIFCSLRQTR
ncbi:hypothetical protein F4679DRAFT_545980 [Xylaria curta]|nr:hypothetical protein F4679DRAFT_545980 [Xylaria curta]